MYTRILVPVDGSEFSEKLIASAAQVARATGAAMALLRVAVRDDEQAAAQRYVEALAAPHGAQALWVRAPASGIAAAIRDEAKRVAGTLVVICSHGHSGAMQVIFGSVALEVLRELGEPMLVYRPVPDRPAAPSRVGRVVLPLDGSATSEAIVDQAAGFAKWLGAKIVVVSVISPELRVDANVPAGDVGEEGYVRSRARAIADRHGVAVGWEVLHGEPGEAIPSFVRGLGDALLAMTTHGRTGLRGVLAGSVTAQCMRDAGVPVYTRLP